MQIPIYASDGSVKPTSRMSTTKHLFDGFHTPIPKRRGRLDNLFLRVDQLTVGQSHGIHDIVFLVLATGIETAKFVECLFVPVTFKEPYFATFTAGSQRSGSHTFSVFPVRPHGVRRRRLKVIVVPGQHLIPRSFGFTFTSLTGILLA